MTKLELIKIIGDLLTKLDVAIGSVDLDDPRRIVLKLRRADLDSRQRELVHLALDEVADAVAEPMKELEAGTKQLKKTIDDLGQLDQTLESIVKLISVVDQLITTAAGLMK